MNNIIFKLLFICGLQYFATSCGKVDYPYQRQAAVQTLKENHSIFAKCQEKQLDGLSRNFSSNSDSNLLKIVFQIDSAYRDFESKINDFEVILDSLGTLQSIPIFYASLEPKARVQAFKTQLTNLYEASKVRFKIPKTLAINTDSIFKNLIDGAFVCLQAPIFDLPTLSDEELILALELLKTENARVSFESAQLVLTMLRCEYPVSSELLAEPSIFSRSPKKDSIGISLHIAHPFLLHENCYLTIGKDTFFETPPNHLYPIPTDKIGAQQLPITVHMKTYNTSYKQQLDYTVTP